MERAFSLVVFVDLSSGIGMKVVVGLGFGVVPLSEWLGVSFGFIGVEVSMRGFEIGLMLFFLVDLDMEGVVVFGSGLLSDVLDGLDGFADVGRDSAD